MKNFVMRKFIRLTIIVSLIALMVPNLFGPLGIAEGESTNLVTLNPTDDSFVEMNGGDKNYGSDTFMYAKKQTDRTRYSFLKFDVADIGDVSNAKLRIYARAWSGDSILYAHGVMDDGWNESSITWNSMPAIDGIAAGATTSKVNLQQYWDIDVTEYIKNESIGDGIASIALQGTNSNTIEIHSKENELYPPALIITEDGQSPTPEEPDEPLPENPSTLYVDPTGANGAYTTIQAALNAVNTGGIVELKSGTYVENVTMSQSGTEQGIITIRGEDNGDVTLNGSLLIDADYIKVENFSMNGENADGSFTIPYAVKVEGIHVHVVNMDIRSYAGPGIYYTPASHYGYAADNYIYSSAQGFHVASHAIIENNEIEALHLHGNNSAAGDHFRIFGSDIIIRNNHAHGTTKGEHMGPAHVDMFQSWDDTQIQVSNVLIENNILTGWYHQGIMLENDKYGPQGTYYISDWTVRNNVFSGYESWGISGGKTNGGIPNMIVENNVFAASETGGYYGVVMIGNGGSGILRNNIFMNHTVTSSGAQSGATIDADYNMYYNTVLPVTIGENDIMGMDPRFVDPSSLDYRLLSDSPAIDTGVVRSSFASDVENNPRPTGFGWDQGAYEFQGTPDEIAPFITITNPSFAEVFAVGSDVQVEVNARDIRGSIEKVDYYLSGEYAGTSEEEQFGITFDNMLEGTYTIHAIATNVNGLSSESNEIQFFVTNEETMMADTTFMNTPFEEQTDMFSVSFEIIPLLNGMNGVVAVAGGDVSAFSGMAAAVRLNPQGSFDVRSGSSYVAENIVPYEMGKSYDVTMVIDILSHTYSVYVKPEDGVRQTIGTGLSFRTEQANVTLLNRLVTIAESGSFMLKGFTLNTEPIEPEPTYSLIGLIELTEQLTEENNGNPGISKVLVYQAKAAVKLLESYIKTLEKQGDKVVTPEQLEQLKSYAETLIEME